MEVALSEQSVGVSNPAYRRGHYCTCITMKARVCCKLPFVPARGLNGMGLGLAYESYKNRVRSNYDVVIAGGGIMGCASAYFLAKRLPGRSICIVERDPNYERASTVLSVGSIRQQFSIRGNIEMSLFSSSFIRNIGSHLAVGEEDAPDVQFVNGAYLFLASDKGKEVLQENYETQRSVGAAVELMQPAQLRERFPWLNTSDLSLGCIGTENEGWFDPWSLLSAFKKKALSMGVQYITGQVEAVGMDGNRVENVKVKALRDNHVLQCKYLVNAAGPWASDVARMTGVGDANHSNTIMHFELPVRPRRRCVFVFHCPNGPADNILLIDPSGAYCRKEGTSGTYICGKSPSQLLDKNGEDLEVDYELFEEHIWPLLAHRVPAFEALKLQSAWAGYYDYNTFDQNAIIGAHPLVSNLVFVNGFSGHGIQQSPAAGKAVSELIVDGHTHSIDLSDFGFERIVQKQLLQERNVV